MPAIIAWLGTVVTQIFTDKVLSWIAFKALMIFLFVVIVPIVLNNFIYSLIEIVMNFANSQLQGANLASADMSFTGIAAWLIQIFKVPECISVVTGALALRSVLAMIPFVRL